MKWFNALTLILAVQGCCPCFAASPRAVAAVAVAVAVDGLLQTNTPALPDDLGGEEREAEPQPEPAAGCQCGCNQSNCHCGKPAAVSGCAAVDAAPVLTIDDAAIDSLKPQHKEEVVVYTQAGCGPCERMKGEFPNGDADVLVRFTDAPAPFLITAYPTIYLPRANVSLVGYRSLQQIRQWLSLPAVKPSARAIGSVTVGTINGDAIRSILDQVKATKAGGVITVGNAALTVPARMSTDVELTPEVMSVRFTATKPRLSYGSGWLAVSQPISAISASRSTVVIGLDGFPDLVLRVE
jgi:hypothetical protein